MLMYKGSISSLELSKFLTWLLLVGLLVDIGGGFGLKYIILVFFLGFALVKSLKANFDKSIFLDISVCAFFSAAALLSVIRGNEFGAAFSEVSFLAFVFLIVLGKGVGANFIESIFLRVSFYAAIVIVITFTLILLFPEIGIAATSFAKENRLGYIGLKSIDSGVPNVYFRWSSWLLLGFSLSLFLKKYLLSAVILTAAVMTLSTAIIGGIFLIIFSYTFMDGRLGHIKIFKIFFSFILVFVGILLAMNMFPDVLQEIISKFSTSSVSSSVKLGHIESILNLLSNNPSYLIYGQGPGSSFYSVGVDAFVTNVEVSHFNLLRQFGLLGFIFFFSYTCYVVICLLCLGRPGYPWAVGLTVMFLVAGTNPLLLSPIFFVPIMLGRIYYLEFIEAKKYERAKNRGSNVDI
jgi:hypothetical protein